MSDNPVGADVRQAILDLCAAYNWCTDTGDAHGVAALFTPDGAWDGPPGRYEGTAAIVDFNQRIHQVIRGSMHFNGNHQFEADGDRIRHRCFSALHLVSDDGVQIQLMTYEDIIVRLDGEWRFAERINRNFDPAVFS